MATSTNSQKTVLSKIWDVLFLPALAIGTLLYFYFGSFVVNGLYEKIGFVPFFRTSTEETEFLKALASYTLTIMFPLAVVALLMAVGLLIVAIMRTHETETK